MQGAQITSSKIPGIMSGVEAPKLYPKVNLKGGKMNSVIRLLEVRVSYTYRCKCGSRVTANYCLGE